MADREEDKSENKGVSGLYNHTLGRQTSNGTPIAGEFAGETLRNVFAMDGYGTNLPIVLFFGAILSGIGGAVWEGGEQALWSTEVDATMQNLSLSSDTPEGEGYFALTREQDNRDYLLIYKDNTWRLYEDGKMILSQQEAWSTIASLTTDFEATINTLRADGPIGNAWQNTVYESIDQAYLGENRSEEPLIERNVGEEQIPLALGRSLEDHYTSLQASWENAASEIKAGSYGITQADLDNIQPLEQLSLQETKDKFVTLASVLGAFWVGGATVAAGISSVHNTSPTTRRQRQQRRKKR